jgi:hypothetical protein
VSATKWKIQAALYHGWVDVKTSFDGGPYVDDHYDTIEEAQTQMADFIHSEEDGSGYRVVEAYVTHDHDHNE